MRTDVIPDDRSDEFGQRGVQCPFCGQWLEGGGSGNYEPCPHLLCETMYDESWYTFWNSGADCEGDARTLCDAVVAFRDDVGDDNAVAQRQLAKAPVLVQALLAEMLLLPKYEVQNFVGRFADQSIEWDDDYGSGTFFFARDANVAGTALHASIQETLHWLERHIPIE